MALVRRKVDDNVPGGLVKLTEDEALTYQLELVRDWVPKSDVWPFHYSMSMLAGLGALSGIYVNKHYRKQLHLRNLARISTYIPIVALPGIICAVFHNQFVMTDVVLGKTRCAVCVQSRAAALQVAVGAIYPMLLAPLATFTFAARLHTYNVPLLTSANGRRQAFMLWQKLTRPIATPILLLMGLQAIAATCVTAAEQHAIARVHDKLRQVESKLLDQESNY